MDSEQAKQLGRYLRQEREAQSISTRFLASAVGIDMAQIVRIEQGAVGYLEVTGPPRHDIFCSDKDAVKCPGCLVHP